MKIIQDRKIVEDDWHLVGDDDAAGPHAIVSLKRWNAEGAALRSSGGPLGVVLRPDEEADDVTDLSEAALVAVDFPAFSDGRGYSTAHALRTRLGYTGDIRAVGDVLRDQLFLMQRCGMSSFALKDGKDFDEALEGLDDFSVTYQASADDGRPLFRRVPR